MAELIWTITEYTSTYIRHSTQESYAVFPLGITLTLHTIYWSVIFYIAHNRPQIPPCLVRKQVPRTGRRHVRKFAHNHSQRGLSGPPTCPTTTNPTARALALHLQTSNSTLLPTATSRDIRRPHKHLMAAMATATPHQRIQATVPVPLQVLVVVQGYKA